MRSLGILSFLTILTVVITLSTAFEINAQDYVVTSKGDTITGQVKPLVFGPDKKVQITGDDKKKVSYPMFQVKSYRFKNEIYQPVKGPDGYTFMKLIHEGYVSLYAYQLPNQVTFDGSFLLRRDGKGIDVPNLGFKKYMKNFMEDCPSTVEKLENGDYSKRDLQKIIDEYNACIDAKTIDHGKIITEKVETNKKLSAWDILEEKVKGEADFEGKANALEMIQDIKGKISKGEKIPNFLLGGLKSALTQENLKPELEAALKEIN